METLIINDTSEHLSELVPYRCPKCGHQRKFATLRELRLHLQNDHSFQMGFIKPHQHIRSSIFQGDSSKSSNVKVQNKSLIREAMKNMNFNSISSHGSSQFFDDERNTRDDSPLLESFRAETEVLERELQIAKQRELRNKTKSMDQLVGKNVNNDRHQLIMDNDRGHEARPILKHMPVVSSVDVKNTLDTMNSEVMKSRLNQWVTSDALYKSQDMLHEMEQAAEEKCKEQRDIIQNLLEEVKTTDQQLQETTREHGKLNQERTRLFDETESIVQEADTYNRKLQGELRKRGDVVENLSSELEALKMHYEKAMRSKETDLQGVKEKMNRLEWERDRMLAEMEKLLHQADTDGTELRNAIKNKEQQLEKVNTELSSLRWNQQNMLEKTMEVYKKAEESQDMMKSVLSAKDDQLRAALQKIERMKEMQKQLIEESRTLTDQADENTISLKKLLQMKENQVREAMSQLEFLRQEKRQLEDSSASMVEETKSSMAAVQNLKTIVKNKEKDLQKSKSELHNLKTYFQSVAEKERLARAKLEYFIENLINRAESAETELRALRSQSSDESPYVNSTIPAESMHVRQHEVKPDIDLSGYEITERQSLPKRIPPPKPPRIRIRSRNGVKDVSQNVVKGVSQNGVKLVSQNGEKHKSQNGGQYVNESSGKDISQNRVKDKDMNQSGVKDLTRNGGNDWSQSGGKDLNEMDIKVVVQGKVVSQTEQEKVKSLVDEFADWRKHLQMERADFTNDQSLNNVVFPKPHRKSSDTSTFRGNQELDIIKRLQKEGSSVPLKSPQNVSRIPKVEILPENLSQTQISKEPFSDNALHVSKTNALQAKIYENSYEDSLRKQTRIMQGQVLKSSYHDDDLQMPKKVYHNAKLTRSPMQCSDTKTIQPNIRERPLVRTYDGNHKYEIPREQVIELVRLNRKDKRYREETDDETDKVLRELNNIPPLPYLKSPTSSTSCGQRERWRKDVLNNLPHTDLNRQNHRYSFVQNPYSSYHQHSRYGQNNQNDFENEQEIFSYDYQQDYHTHEDRRTIFLNSPVGERRLARYDSPEEYVDNVVSMPREYSGQVRKTKRNSRKAKHDNGFDMSMPQQSAQDKYAEDQVRFYIESEGFEVLDSEDENEDEFIYIPRRRPGTIGKSRESPEDLHNDKEKKHSKGKLPLPNPRFDSKYPDTHKSMVNLQIEPHVEDRQQERERSKRSKSLSPAARSSASRDQSSAKTRSHQQASHRRSPGRESSNVKTRSNYQATAAKSASKEVPSTKTKSHNKAVNGRSAIGEGSHVKTRSYQPATEEKISSMKNRVAVEDNTSPVPDSFSDDYVELQNEEPVNNNFDQIMDENGILWEDDTLPDVSDSELDRMSPSGSEAIATKRPSATVPSTVVSFKPSGKDDFDKKEHSYSQAKERKSSENDDTKRLISDHNSSYRKSGRSSRGDDNISLGILIQRNSTDENKRKSRSVRVVQDDKERSSAKSTGKEDSEHSNYRSKTFRPIKSEPKYSSSERELTSGGQEVHMHLCTSPVVHIRGSPESVTLSDYPKDTTSEKSHTISTQKNRKPRNESLDETLKRITEKYRAKRAKNSPDTSSQSCSIDDKIKSIANKYAKRRQDIIEGKGVSPERKLFEHKNTDKSYSACYTEPPDTRKISSSKYGAPPNKYKRGSKFSNTKSSEIGLENEEDRGVSVSGLTEHDVRKDISGGGHQRGNELPYHYSQNVPLEANQHNFNGQQFVRFPVPPNSLPPWMQVPPDSVHMPSRNQNGNQPGSQPLMFPRYENRNLSGSQVPISPIYQRGNQPGSHPAMFPMYQNGNQSMSQPPADFAYMYPYFHGYSPMPNQMLGEQGSQLNHELGNTNETISPSVNADADNKESKAQSQNKQEAFVKTEDDVGIINKSSHSLYAASSNKQKYSPVTVSKEDVDESKVNDLQLDVTKISPLSLPMKESDIETEHIPLIKSSKKIEHSQNSNGKLMEPKVSKSFGCDIDSDSDVSGTVDACHEEDAIINSGFGRKDSEGSKVSDEFVIIDDISSTLAPINDTQKDLETSRKSDSSLSESVKYFRQQDSEPEGFPTDLNGDEAEMNLDHEAHSVSEGFSMFAEPIPDFEDTSSHEQSSKTQSMADLLENFSDIDVDTDTESAKREYFERSQKIKDLIDTSNSDFSESYLQKSSRNTMSSASSQASMDMLEIIPLSRREEVKHRRQVLRHIFYFLDTATLCRVAQVCREWRVVSKSPKLWRRVELRSEKISSEFLLHAARRCSQLKVLILEDIRPRNRKKTETIEEYQENIQSSLEVGYEQILKRSESTLHTISIINCGTLLSAKCLWAASCYSRMLKHVTYLSDFDPITAEVMWALGSGCRDLRTLQVHPLNPCKRPGNFSTRCAQLIGKCFPDLEKLSLGSVEVDTKSLVYIAKQCRKLKSLELDHMSLVPTDVIADMCDNGLKYLTCIRFIATPVAPEGLKTLQANCHYLDSIYIQMTVNGYFKATKQKEDLKLFRKEMNKLEELRKSAPFANMLRLKLSNLPTISDKEQELEQEEDGAVAGFFKKILPF